jgi:hypothetical protein
MFFTNNKKNEKWFFEKSFYALKMRILNAAALQMWQDGVRNILQLLSAFTEKISF